MSLVLSLGTGISATPATGQAPLTGQKTPCTDGQADSYPCRNVDLLSFLPIDELGGNASVNLNDIWGWTDPQTGAEYAIVGRTDGTAFVDVSDPTNPVYLGELPTHSGSSPWRDVKVYDNHAYVVSEASNHGLQVFDLTRLRSVDEPPVAFAETAHYDRFSTAHNVAVNPESGYAYVVGIGGEQDVPASADCGAGLHIVDIRAPDQPEFAGCHTDLSTGRGGSGYTHDAQCVMYQGPDSDYQGQEICFNANETQLNIADVTEKDAPETIANATYPLTGYVHQAWLTEDQKYLLVDDETDEQSFFSINKTRTLVFDLSDLDNPTLVKKFFGETGAIDHNQYVKGRFSYQANYEGGLRILDVSDPENPAEVGYFDTYPSSNEAAFNGAWSTYPFFDSGIIVVSSIGEGLFVLEPTAPPLGAPDRVSAEGRENGQTARLQWGRSEASKRPSSARDNAVASGAPRYHIYRSTTLTDSPPTDRTPLDSVSFDSHAYTDTTVTRGDTYYYRVTAVDSSGAETDFSDRARAFLYPDELSVSVHRSFDGAATASDYRLVALPGRGSRPLPDVISGRAGTEWQAYDDGSGETPFVRFDGSDRFVFRPGNGFWLTARSDWAFTGDTPTVKLDGDSVAPVPLREGWNIISNPTGQNVPWKRVQAVTEDTLQALWDFDGTFSRADTFRSARSGRAYYFFNDEASRDTLAIPYPDAPGRKANSADPASSLLTLTARPENADEASGSTVQIGFDEHAIRGLGPEDLIAPPGRFEPVHLRIAFPKESPSGRTRSLMVDRRPPVSETSGATFDLTLTSRVDAPVRLTVRGADGWKGRNGVLLRPDKQASHRLRSDPTLTIEPNKQHTSLKIAIGTEAYVTNRSEAVLPDQVRLTSYPNPLSDQGTIAYTLPEPTEVTLRVHDALGRTVAVLASGDKTEGRHTVRPVMDNLSSGLYVVQLQAAGQTVTRKITVVH